MAKKTDPRKTLDNELKSSVFLIAVPVIVFAFQIIRVSRSVWITLLSFVAVTALMAVFIWFSGPVMLKRFKTWIDASPNRVWVFPLAAWLFINLFASLSGQFAVYTLLGSLVWCILPVALARQLRNKGPKLQWLDVLIVLVLWFPVEFGLLSPVILPPGAGLPILHLTGVLLLFYIYLVLRDLPDIGYSFRLKQNEWQVAVMTFLALLPILIGIGMATDFISLAHRLSGIGVMLSQLVTIYFLVAIPEEMLFRGVIQNLVEKRLPGKHAGWLALIITSVIFGLTHINNTIGPIWQLGSVSVPWGYVLMATLAGLGYGYTWYKTKKITAAALVHLLVNWTWIVIFNG